MPFLEGPFGFIGKLDMLSAYRMHGVDGIVVRRKGGPSAEKIKTAESFKNTRRTMSEFGGCSRHGSYVRMAMLQVRRMADYNFGSDINSVMRQVQLRDGTSEWGRRRISLSEHTRLLEGFSTTRKAPTFDSIVRAPIYYTLDRQTRSARIDLPELVRDINYFPQNNHPLFHLTVTLGIVPDIEFDIASKEYLPPTWYSPEYYSAAVSTDWNPSLEGMNGKSLEFAMDAPLPPDNAWTLMLSIGIEYGSLRQNGKVEKVRRFGAAKIMSLLGKGEGPGADKGHKPFDEEVNFVEEETPAPKTDLPTTTEAQQAVEQSKIQYVYTVKEPEMKKQDARVYTYVIAGASQKSTNTVPTPCNESPTRISIEAPPITCDNPDRKYAVARLKSEITTQTVIPNVYQYDSIARHPANLAGRFFHVTSLPACSDWRVHPLII